MIAGAEIARSLQGAFRLASRDTGGLQWFDTSIGGFWNSFFAAVLVAPFYIAIIASRPADPPTTVTPSAYALTEMIAYVCAWFAFPLAMVYVTRFMGREKLYIPYIVAANWCSTIPLGLFGILALLGSSGAVPHGVSDFLALVVFFWALSFQWFVARTALQLNGFGAVGIVAMDLAIGLLITGAANAITTQTG